MQAEDWGTYAQEPWMTGGAWKDITDRSHHRPQKPHTKTKQAATNPPPIVNPSDNDPLLRAEVDSVELRLKLRRWTFDRSWKVRSSNSRSEEEEGGGISPRCLIEASSHTVDPITNPSSTIAPPQAETKNKERSDEPPRFRSDALKMIPKPTSPLEKDVMAQYLDRCIAVAETQLAEARGRGEKKGAVREIERLVERVVREGKVG